jgi:hypothetical protein
MAVESGGAIPQLCPCQPPEHRRQCRDGVEEVVCARCGASAIALSSALPAYVRDRTRYEVSVRLTPELLRRHLPLLKRKSGLSTPLLLSIAREGGKLVLPQSPMRPLFYDLKEYEREQLPVQVDPPYPHSLAQR